MTDRTLDRRDFLAGAAGFAAALGFAAPARALRALAAPAVEPPPALPEGWVFPALQNGWTSHPDFPLRFRIDRGLVRVEGQAVGGRHEDVVIEVRPDGAVVPLEVT